jgi:ABC-type amino acid transport substrate-binding protein
MKPRSIVVLALFFVFASYPAFSSPPEINRSEFLSSLTLDEKAWLQSAPPLRMVYDPDWAPFEWQSSDGNHIGVIADIIQSIQLETGLNIEVINTSTWAESVAMVQEGKADFFSAITVTPERENFLNFTRNDIYSYPAVLLTHFSDPSVYLDAQHDLHGKKIGIVKSSGLGNFIRTSHPNLSFIEVPSTESGIIQLRDGKIDLFAINSITGRYYIEKKGFESLKIALKLDYAYSLKIGVRKTLPREAISILDKGLRSITFAEINRIVNKWVEAPIKHKIDWSITAKISIFLLLIIAFFALFSKHLKRKVQIKTQELELKNQALEESIREVDLLRKREKENIYRATVHGSQHILNNLLNQLSLIDQEICKHPEFNHQVSVEFKAMRLHAKELTEQLASVENIEEEEIKKSVSPK